jgi:hypothetical protein
VHVRTIIPLDKFTLSRIHWLVKAEHLSPEISSPLIEGYFRSSPLMTAGGDEH